MFPPRRQFLVAAALTAASAHPSFAEASYPSRPIRVIVPYPAGGVVDQYARIVIDAVNRQWPTGFVVEPIPGASSSIGTRKAKQSKPDGYTWLINGPALIANPHLFNDAGWNVLRDFVPVANAGYGPLVLVAKSSAGISSLKMLLDKAKASPGTLTAGTSHGSSVHISLEMLRKTTGIDVTLVPYSGAPQIMQALGGGQIDFSFLPYMLAQPHVESGRLVALALSSSARSSLFPNVPTFAELGLGDSAFLSWYTFVVPRMTPVPLLKQINDAFNKALVQPDVIERIKKQGGEAGSPMSIAELEKMVKTDDDKLSQLIRSTNMRGE
ncbi:Bug family tripartite tricarboxylate transporter substrate binding protein [Ottowia sp. VDI28]|uniref:Bug family tripartite tricarboxylate transporter substrate binding protein n=1 Tax=Ottowia sp. VDI28 TaxID=3133968 RepID=UPI003C2B2C52